MKAIAAAAVLMAALTACGDHPVPAHGHITDRTHSDEMWLTTTNCYPSGQSTVCYPTTTYYPEEWRVEVTDLKNGGWVGSVEVKQDVYDRCDIGKLWPECWGGRA